jgi:hypothetical protein
MALSISSMLNPSSDYSYACRVLNFELHSLTTTVEEKSLAETLISMSSMLSPESSDSSFIESGYSSTSLDSPPPRLTFFTGSSITMMNSGLLPPIHQSFAKEPIGQFPMRLPRRFKSIRTKKRNSTEFNRVSFLRMLHRRHH